MIKHVRESSINRSSAKAVLPALAGALVIWVVAFMPVTSTSEAIAQTAASPRFDVASIKPAAPNPPGELMKVDPGGRTEITNVSLKRLIAFAWHVQPFQISGGPSWLDSVHYDIIAKPGTKPKPGDVALMMQALLKDRFQLTLHQETRELPTHALVMARKDAKLGPRLIEAKEGDCTPRDPANHLPPPEPGKRFCGQTIIGSRRLTAVSIPIANLTQVLPRLLGHPVLDRTGLTGNFDINLEWTPDDLRTMPSPPDASDMARGPGKKGGAAETLFPPLPAALQQQLGLKLDSQKGPVEILVIDRAEKPSEN